MYFLNILIISLSFFISSCSNNIDNNITKKKENIEKPESMYLEAMKAFDLEEFDISLIKFDEITKFYPLSNESIQAQIMIGFIHYIRLDYEKAVSKFEKVIMKYPSHKSLDYVYYMKALCSYEQLNNAQLDGIYNEIAINDFNQVIKRFPLSKYAKDSRQKIILVKSNQAAKHMSIGKFYLDEKKYTAALNRYKVVVQDYSETKFTPEALHRIVEIYYEIGLKEEANNTAAVLGHNYPDTIWYKYSYNLINKNIDDKSILNSLKNIF